MLNTHRPIRVAVLCSQRAPGLLYLLNRSPDRGAAFEIVCAITSEDTFDEEVVVERRGIPTHPHPIAAFYHARGASNLRDPDIRAEYDAESSTMIERFLPDLILLDGYRYLVTTPLLRRFANRILNLHFADLALRTPRGGPRYPGVRAVRNAIAAGCEETRASVHLVSDEPDGGTVLVRSWPFPVSSLVGQLVTADVPDAIKAYTYAHEQWMMRTASGPLMAAALRLIAAGAIDLDSVAAVEPADRTPWLLEQHGALLAPELELV